MPLPPIPPRSAALRALGERDFDVLVIGGGITGAGIARDAAMRGLAVALVERGDFASGTSSRSSRLIHGGVRYLEHGHLSLVLESSAERRRLLRLAPHLVRPLPFTWPVYRGARVPRWKLFAGLALYDALALFRNVAFHRPLRARSVLEREPGLRCESLIGGALYYDAATDDARLTLANALGAAAAGAVVVNYASAESLRMRGGRVLGAVVRDRETGREAAVEARVVVNATGPWIDVVHRFERREAPALVRGTKGVHVSVPRERLGNNDALTLLSPTDGRVMFVLPAGIHAMIGTTDTETIAPPDDVRADEADIAYLLGAANHFFPDAHLVRGDVVSAWAGIRPLIASGFEGTPASASREHLVSWTPGGVLVVSGGKLTTYRVMAADAVDAIASRLGAGNGSSPTAVAPLPGGDLPTAGSRPNGGIDAVIVEAERRIGEEETARHLVCAYGSAWRDVWTLAESDAALRAPVVPGLPYIGAELVHAVRHEMARTIGDLLVRRTKVAWETRDHALGIAREVAARIAPELGWDEERVARAVADYEREIDRLFTVEPAPSRTPA